MAYPQTVQRCHEVIARLEDQIECLKAQLEHDADPDETIEVEAFGYGLSRRQTDLYRLLRSNRVCTLDMLRDEFGTRSYVDVIIVKTKQKLKPHGLSITNQHGVGYRLEGL